MTGQGEGPESTETTRKSRRALVSAIAPFVAIPVAIAAYALGRPGLTAALIGMMFASIHVPDFLNGTATRRSGLIPGVEGTTAIFKRNVPLDGGWARLSNGRYVIAAAVLVGGGVVETIRPGWAAGLFRDGAGWAWLLILAGSLLAMTAVVGVAPARDPVPTPAWGKAVSFLANGVGLLLSVALVVAGISELLSPGAIRDVIQNLNPLASTR